MLKDALWLVQCSSHISAADGQGTNKGNQEVWYDVVIATPTLEDHIERLDEILACMKRARLKCKHSKCEFLDVKHTIYEFLDVSLR